MSVPVNAMTDPGGVSSPGTAGIVAGPAESAREVADRAADRSGVRIRVVHDLDGLEQVRRVIHEIWQPAPEDPPVSRTMLRALAHAGNYCALAYDGDEPVGVCVGFLGVEPPNTVHSHIAGVLGSAGGRHIGFALKQHQRAWAVDRGIGTITWTYDPLVRRNAFFNMTKLGALPTEYAEDFYGEMSDSINAGERTDRLVVHWDLLSQAAVAAGRCAEVVVAELLARGAQIVVDESAEGPVVTASSAPVQLVRVPPDIEALRLGSPETARRWRFAVRDTLGDLMRHGWSVTAFSRDGFYVLAEEGDPSRD